MSWNIAKVGLPVALAVSSLAVAPATGVLVAHRGVVNVHSSVTQPGVVYSVNVKRHRFVYTARSTKYMVTYTSKTMWSAQLNKVLNTGWHIIVKGQLNNSMIAAVKIVNSPEPERIACVSDARAVNTAVAAYEVYSGGKAPPTVTSLTTKAHGGPYLVHVPGNRTFYRIALNWGGSPAKENGGKHHGDVYVAGVWIGSVGKYRDYTTLGTAVCNAAT